MILVCSSCGRRARSESCRRTQFVGKDSDTPGAVLKADGERFTCECPKCGDGFMMTPEAAKERSKAT